MKNYYKKSKKEFIKFIKKNPYCSKKDWDEYAQENCLFSSFSISCHEITDNTLKILQKNNIDQFKFLKELYIIIPNLKIKIMINKIKKILNFKEKREKIDG